MGAQGRHLPDFTHSAPVSATKGRCDGRRGVAGRSRVEQGGDGETVGVSFLGRVSGAGVAVSVCVPSRNWTWRHSLPQVPSLHPLAMPTVQALGVAQLAILSLRRDEVASCARKVPQVRGALAKAEVKATGDRRVAISC
ncbi:MAG: hypothetical protein PVTTEEND_002102 [Candidatus Fervidibacter sp.]